MKITQLIYEDYLIKLHLSGLALTDTPVIK